MARRKQTPAASEGSDRNYDNFEWAETGMAGTPEAGLLQAVREAPDDDTPRLIYADWLEDHNQPERAELIRVQCEMARLPPGPRAATLRQREQELLARHAAGWTAPLVALGASGTFRRGLLEHAVLSADAFARHADELLRAAPLLALTVSMGYGAQGLLKVLRCRHLLGMTELHVTGGPCRRMGAKMIAESPNVANLTRLSLAFQELSRPAVQDLADSPYLARLTHLDLSYNFLGRRWLLPLAGSGHLANLTSLDVRGSFCTTEDAAALANSPCLTKLTELGFEPGGLAPDEFQKLLHSPNLAHLTTLRLSNSALVTFGGPRVQALTTSPLLPRLTTLTLSAWIIGNLGAAELAGAAQTANLTTLGLVACGITAAGVEALASSRHLANLTSLDLSANDIGNGGARALAESPYLKHLACLDLSRCGIGPQGTRALAASTNLPDYLALNLTGNRLDKAARQALSRFSCLKVE
jgi:uncharacterized protein (TIGR02996 family)